jgi:hypothetical protein
VEVGDSHIRVQVKGTIGPGVKRSGLAKGKIYSTPTYVFKTDNMKGHCDLVALVALDMEKILYVLPETCINKSKVWVPIKRMEAASDAALLDVVSKYNYPMLSKLADVLVGTPHDYKQPSPLPSDD